MHRHGHVASHVQHCNTLKFRQELLYLEETRDQDAPTADEAAEAAADAAPAAAAAAAAVDARLCAERVC